MGIMGFIWMVIVGLIVVAIARLIMPGAQSMGWIMSILGALVVLWAYLQFAK